jgi:hypothetical protein
MDQMMLLKAATVLYAGNYLDALKFLKSLIQISWRISRASNLTKRDML